MTKVLIGLTAALLMLSIPASAQVGFEVQAAEVFRTAGMLDVDVMIRSTGATPFVLGTSTFVFNYDTLGMQEGKGNPVKVAANDGPWDQQSDADYLNVTLVSDTSKAFAGLIVDFAGDPELGDYNGATVPSSFTRIGTIRFTITDPGRSSKLQWRAIGVTTTVNRLGNPGIDDSQVTVTSSGSFLVPQDMPLPITLASFGAGLNSKGAGVLLSWSTLSEVNNYGFYVQRRADNDSSAYKDVANGFVAGHGTTIEPQSYSFVDNTITRIGRYYYRLRQVDLDGSEHFTSGTAVSIDVALTSVKEVAPIEFKLHQNYPNPFNPSTELKFSVEKSGRATLRVYNIAGQEVATLFDDVAEAGQYYRVRMDGANLATGVYFYRLESASKVDLKKMVLLK